MDYYLILLDKLLKKMRALHAVEIKNISLYETYEGKNNISKEKWKEQTYWSPKSFKDTDDVKTKFKAWYYLDMDYVKEKSETENIEMEDR